MLYITEGLYPEKVFKNFENLSRIPRGSGKEKAVSDYIYNFAKSLGLEARQDEYNNLIIKKPATAGKEHLPAVLLQAHMDMVTEAGEFSTHDFENDPIELLIDGGKLRANNTTLGADNGIGVAYIMTILESTDISHPDLECVLTADEEMGLIGVNKIDLSDLKATYIINLDSEEEINILVGCAGAVNAQLSLRKEYKPAVPTNIALEINVRGLSGGHSGMDIDKQKGNANVIMGRILSAITYDYDLFCINGGSKRNAIPRNSEAVISIRNEDLEEAVRQIQKTSAKIQKEYYPSEPYLKIELRRTPPADFKVFTKDCRNKIISIMMLAPDGVMAKSLTIDDAVETSSNFAIVRETGYSIDFTFMIRSNSESKKEFMKKKLEYLAKAFKCKIEFSSEYPAWEHRQNSALEDFAKEVYCDQFGICPNIVVMHCGLECGILLDKLPHKAQAISIGPDMAEVHTPEEYVVIESVGKVWDYLVNLLDKIY